MSMEDRRRPDTRNVESELIGILYETAFDPDFWTDLLVCVANLFEDRRFDSQKPPIFPDDDLEYVRLFTNRMDKDEVQRLATLLPHLYRALKLKREFNDVNHTRGQAQAIIEQFPLGVLLVNSKGKLISANQHALNTIANSNTMHMENGVLCITEAKQDQQLKSLIRDVANSPWEKAGEHVSFFKIGEKGMDSPVSLLVTPDPYPPVHFDRQVENCAAIFIASASVKQRIEKSALQTIFNLSPAEARLAALLAGGMSLNQAADQSCISKNTAKVQLKSIFLKMGVNRQAELVKLILTSPAVFNPVDKEYKNVRLATGAKSKSCINNEGHITLRDGRKLQYAEYGDPQGKPVIHMHGIIGCRYERFPDDLLTRKLGVRLIVPDRPGYGLSEYAPGHGYLDFADDLLELVDHLDIQQCSIMGLSVGAIYASAFAYKTPKRLHNIAMICLTPPFRSFSDFAGMSPTLKLFLAFSKYLPTAAHMIADTAIKKACNNPEKFLANIPVCLSDRAILSHPQLREHIESCLLAGNKNCHSGFVHDTLLPAEPWPFAIEDIQTKMYFWHGTEDTHSPLSRIKPIVDVVPNNQFYSIKGGGHFLIYDHWQKILTTLIH